MAKRRSKKPTEGGRFREDGHVTFEFMGPGMKFILLRNNDRVVRENLRSTTVEVFVKLWQPAAWTKKYKPILTLAKKELPPPLTEYPTALQLRTGVPAHIPDNQEVQILY